MKQFIWQIEISPIKSCWLTSNRRLHQAGTLLLDL
jgi:hypothetical protein